MLIKLAQASTPTTVEAIDDFSVVTPGWYLSRWDCAYLFGSSGLGSHYKIFRDGTVVRICSSTTGHSGGLSLTHDLPISLLAGGPHYLNDPVSTKYDKSRLAPITYANIVTDGHAFPVVYNGFYYHVSGAATVAKRNLATGALSTTITTTGIITFSGDRLDITPEGLLVVMDFDNGTNGVLRFYDLNTGAQYTSATERSKFMWIDRVNKNVWSLGLSDSLLRVYSFEIAPYQFNPFTVGSNRSRYRQDAVSGTLLGAQSEPVRLWPVGWRLTQPSMGGGFLGDFEVGYGALGSNGALGPSAEGHLESDYTETDENGVTTNLYCGPGAVDYVGQSATIEAWTGY